MRLIDLTGGEFGQLVVIGRSANLGRHVYWSCQCACGRSAEVKGDHLKAGLIAHCGCQKASSEWHSTSRNGRPSPTYKSWQSMIERTTNPAHQAWKYYGGRGITVCDRWRTFSNFLADMGERPTDLTLDRIDNDRGYEPGNCRWATRTEQTRNRRNMRRVA